MWLKIGKFLGRVYTLVLATAAGGLVGANLAGFVPAIGEQFSQSQRAPDPEAFLRWIHGGWIVGATLFFGSGVLPTWRGIRKDWRGIKTLSKRRKRTRRNRSPARRKPFEVKVGSHRCGVVGSIWVGILGGGLLGTFIGGPLLLFWFSIAYSPFAPDGWASSTSAEQIGSATRHPVAVWCLFGPILFGAAALGIVCGVGTAWEQWKRWKRRDD